MFSTRPARREQLQHSGRITTTDQKVRGSSPFGRAALKPWPAETLAPWVTGIVGSLLTTWVTFVPCFLFILLHAPYVERLHANQPLSAALTGITAAVVVGVIANLGLYFTVHTLFADSRTIHNGPFRLELPDPTTIRWVSLAIAAIDGVLMFRFRWSVLRVLGISALLGLVAGLPVS